MLSIRRQQLPILALVVGIFIHLAVGVDRWCGKTYRLSDLASLSDSGGRIEPPSRPSVPLLALKVQPRFTPYLEVDEQAAIFIDAYLSYIAGQPFGDSLVLQQPLPAELLLGDNELALNFGQYGNLPINASTSSSAAALSIKVLDSDTGRLVVPSGSVQIGTNGTVFSFSLEPFRPSFTPYNICLVASDSRGQTYKASTQLLRLPNRTDGGSVTKIDNLYGALLVHTGGLSGGNLNASSTGHLNTLKSGWMPVLPYSYYLDGSWLAKSPGNIAEFKNMGYNVLSIVPGGGEYGFNFTQLDAWLDEAEIEGLWVMFQMRHTYQQTEKVAYQVNRLKARKNMLIWYTADEPDGHTDPRDATKVAYNTIKSLDPYHPVSLCLNCENYYFQDYAAGADILMSDVYPIGTNTSWSPEYNTECNSTYGCCGCDNCHGFNDLSNIADRLDTWRIFQAQLGLPQKPLWGVPQAFSAQAFWKQTPSAEEEVAMNMLSINHGAKGIIMWTFPSAGGLDATTSALAKVLTGLCAGYILGADMTRGLSISGADRIDASAWILGDSMLISIVNPTHGSTTAPVTLHLPLGINAQALQGSLWGDGGWQLISSAQLRIPSLKSVETDILILALDPVLAKERS